MELSVSNSLVKEKVIDVNSFVKELQKVINKSEFGVEVETKSELSLVNNIVKNNKMTNENRKEFFLQERLSLFEIYNKDKTAGELYYIASKGIDNDFYVLTVNKDIGFKIMDETELPQTVKVGDVCRKKNGEINLSKEETNAHSEKMKEVAKGILESQEFESDYKGEFAENELVAGTGYEGRYFEYPMNVIEKLCKKVGLPLSVINNYLRNDINQAFVNAALKLSKANTIYTALPQNGAKSFEFSNGKVKEVMYSGSPGQYGTILIKDKSGKLVENKELTEQFQKEVLQELETNVKTKYDKICNDYMKEEHIYEVKKSLDEDFIPTITIKDISENRFLELEDLNFIKNRYAGDGIYTVKNGEYYKIDVKEEIPKNNTADRDKEDEKNFANIMSEKYNIPKETVEEKMKNFMLEKSQEQGAIIYTGYDMKKDEYYMDYYIEGAFDEREIISKEKADNMEVGTFMRMESDEFDRYSGYFDANELRYELEEIIKSI